MQVRTLCLSEVLVKYLTAIHAKRPEYFSTLSALQNADVLFTESFSEIDNINYQQLMAQIPPEIQKQYVECFKNLSPVIDDQFNNEAIGIARTRFCFITDSIVWDDFWKTLTSNKSSQEQDRLLDIIAGAFACFVISLAVRTFSDDFKKMITARQRVFLTDALLFGRPYELELPKPSSISEAIVQYLETIHAKHPQHFEVLFSVQSKVAGNRLFYNKFDCISANSIHALQELMPIELQDFCLQKFAAISPVINVEFVRNVRRATEACFLTISLTSEWQNFWNNVRFNTVRDPVQQEILLHLIAGAFVFKIFSVVLNTDANKFYQYISKDKFSSLSKVLAHDQDSSHDSKYADELLKIIFTHIFNEALNYENFGKYIKTSDLSNVTKLCESWTRALQETIPVDAKFISQGEAAQIALNERLLAAVQHIKTLEPKPKDAVRDFCSVIYKYLDRYYQKNETAGPELLHAAILLCTGAKELSAMIHSKTSVNSFRVMNDVLVQRKSKWFKSEASTKKDGIPPLMPTSISSGGASKPLERSTSARKMRKTYSVDNMQKLKRPSESPREEAEARASVNLTRSTLTRKSSDSETSNMKKSFPSFFTRTKKDNSASPNITPRNDAKPGSTGF